MSTIVRKEETCIFCGQKTTFDEIMSVYIMGPPDLDTRPGPMMRSLLPYTIQECPNCHYAARNISMNPDKASSYVLSDPEYLKIVADDSIPRVARSFMLAAMVKERAMKFKDAGMLYLNAAWTFDDLRDNERAKEARINAAIDLIVHANETQDIETFVLAVDVYRRAEKFEDADHIIEQKLRSLQEMEKILLLERELIKKQDASRHTMMELYADELRELAKARKDKKE